MNAGIFLKDDPDVNKDQIPFDFEYLDDAGNTTHIDVNLADTFITTASSPWNTVSISTASGISAGSIYTVGAGGSWTFTDLAEDSTHKRLDKIEGVLRKIQDRLAVIEEVDDIEMKKSLRKAYDKYRMVEDMIDKKAKE